HTTLSDIIVRDTDTKVTQDDAFVFTSRHSGTLGGVTSDNPEAPQLVIGSSGTDTLVGGPANDTLVAAQGHQTLTGLAGSDQFVFNVKGINATITDFQHGADKIDFTNIAGINATSGVPTFQGNVTGTGNLTLNAHSVAYVEDGANTQVL